MIYAYLSYYPNQSWYALLTLFFIGSALLPFYSWATLFFSIPIFIAEYILAVICGSSSNGYYIFSGLSYMVPSNFVFAIFLEILLIPMALISPITFMTGIIIWIVGDISGY